MRTAFEEWAILVDALGRGEKLPGKSSVEPNHPVVTTGAWLVLAPPNFDRQLNPFLAALNRAAA